MKAQYQAFAVILGEGDPLPKVGSGFRIIRAKIGRKWVYVRLNADNSPAGRISTAKWARLGACPLNADLVTRDLRRARR